MTCLVASSVASACAVQQGRVQSLSVLRALHVVSSLAALRWHARTRILNIVRTHRPRLRHVLYERYSALQDLERLPSDANRTSFVSVRRSDA
eukprot:1331854-Rhodomonas_salina.1